MSTTLFLYSSIFISSWLLTMFLIKRPATKHFALFLVSALFSWVLLTQIFQTDELKTIAYFICITTYYFLLKTAVNHRLKIFKIACVILPVLLIIAAKTSSTFLVVGVSYMSFRMIAVSIDVFREEYTLPSFFQYFSFLFFPPTIIVGPISPFLTFSESIDKPFNFAPPYRPLCRLTLGLFKIMFLAVFFEQIGLFSLWKDGYYLSKLNFIVGVFSSYLYLYLNFSGICDVVISLSKLIGIDVKENFLNPLTARNLADYWNRWHITLSHFMRDYFYFDSFLTTSRLLPSISPIHVSSFFIFTTFLIVGIWHGFALNFLLLGVGHGIGLVIYNYYSMYYKRLKNDNRERYTNSKLIKILAIACTQLYVSFVSVFFITDLETLVKILKDVS